MGGCLHEDAALLPPHCQLLSLAVLRALIFRQRSPSCCSATQALVRSLFGQIGSAAPEETPPSSGVSILQVLVNCLHFCLLGRSNMVNLLCYHADCRRTSGSRGRWCGLTGTWMNLLKGGWCSPLAFISFFLSCTGLCDQM